MDIRWLRSRRRFLQLSVLSALLVHARPSSAQVEYPLQEHLSWLPDLVGHPRVTTYQLTLKPGQSYQLTFGGPASILVRSGVMTAPITLTKATTMMQTGPELSAFPDTPSGAYTATAPVPPVYEMYQGFAAEDGNLGTIENNGSRNLVAIVMAQSPIPPG